MRKKLILSIAFSFVVYALLFFYFGPAGISTVLARIPIIDFIIAFLFVLLSLFFEFLRWQFYLKQLNIKITYLKSLRIFLSGLSLGLMPAKSGELIRSALLKREKIAFNKTIPIHFISNLTGFLVVLAFSGPILLIYGKKTAPILAAVIILCFFFSLRFPSPYLKILSLIQDKTKIRFIGTLKKSILSSSKLLSIKPLIASLIYTAAYYSCIGISFFFIAKNLEISIPIYIAFSVYSLSLILGVLSLLPGGIGVVEGSSIIILSNHMDPSSSFILIMTIRILTLWLTMLLGVIALNSEIYLRNQNKSK